MRTELQEIADAATVETVLQVLTWLLKTAKDADLTKEEKVLTLLPWNAPTECLGKWTCKSRSISLILIQNSTSFDAYIENNEMSRSEIALVPGQS